MDNTHTVIRSKHDIQNMRFNTKEYLHAWEWIAHEHHVGVTRQYRESVLNKLVDNLVHNPRKQHSDM